MKGKRRSVVAGLGTTLLTALAGYLRIDGSDSSDDGDGRDASDGREDPEPTIVDLTGPNPSLVWVDDEPVADGYHEFSAEIYNAGTPGTVGMTLLWLDDPGATPVSEPATRRERYFEAGEREVLSVTARIPEEYDAYDLQLWVSELDVEIENDGGSGRIGVSVLEGDRTVDETEVPIEAGESVSVAFDGDAEIDPGDFDVEARPAS